MRLRIFLVGSFPLLPLACAALVSAALLAAPTLARAQTVYVSSFPQTIYSVTGSGAPQVFATLPAGTNPLGLTFGSGGNLFVSANSTNQIYQVSPGGAVSLFATMSSGAYDLVYDNASGYLYAALPALSEIDRISPTGVVTPFAFLGDRPIGLAIDSTGNVFTDTLLGNSIIKITPGGATSLFATLPGGNYDLAFNASGVLYASDGSNHIYRIPAPNQVSLFATLPQTSEAKGIIFDAAGNLLVVNAQIPGQILQVSSDGSMVSVFASGLGDASYIAGVPEPSTWMLLGVAGTGMIVLQHRRRRLEAKSETAV